jgi:hypothetical protein
MSLMLVHTGSFQTRHAGTGSGGGVANKSPEMLGNYLNVDLRPQRTEWHRRVSCCHKYWRLMYRFQLVTHKIYRRAQPCFLVRLIDGYTDQTAEIAPRHHNTIIEWDRGLYVVPRKGGAPTMAFFINPKQRPNNFCIAIYELYRP